MSRRAERATVGKDDIISNPLQQLLADAMRAAGMPLERRGSKAELSRRSGVEDAIISNIFGRPRYVPEAQVREALASALGIPLRKVEEAAAEIKGLRVHPTPKSAARLLDEAHADLVLAGDELTPEELAEIEARIEQIQADLQRRARRNSE